MSGLFGGGGQSVSTSAPIISSLRLQTSAFGRPITLAFGRTRVSVNLIDYTDFTAIAHTTTQDSGGGGGKGGGGATQSNTTYTYTAAVIMAICAGVIAGVRNVWKDKSQFTLAALGLSLFTGNYTQSPWGYMTTAHPDRALAYRGLAYWAAGAYDLGDNATLSNHNAEVDALCQYSGSIPDANIKDVITTILTDLDVGLQLPSSVCGDYTQFSNYCVANGIFVSPAYVDREPVSGILERLAKIGNAGMVWSEDKLKIVPYGDTAVTGNSVTFTPVLTPLYDIADDDYLDHDQPVRLVRAAPADAFNQVVLKYYNRANEYNEEPCEGKDQADIELYGLKADPNERVYHEIADAAVAQLVVDQEVRRSLYGARNIYATRVDGRYDLLEPMDLFTLTDAGLDLNRQLVRLLKKDEDEDDNLDLTCEEVQVGTAQPAVYQGQASGGYAPDYNVAPPSTNAPIIFAPPIEIALNTLELWLVASGPSGWGGCEVHVSSDGATYKKVGTVRGPARQGVLSASLAAGADPDTVNTMRVDLTQSLGQLLTGTPADADLARTLCYVGGGTGGFELVSRAVATLTAANKYDCTYLRRGLYGTVISAHSNAAAFACLDEAVFDVPYTAEEIGSTIFVKLPAINVYGAGLQNIADVSATSIVIPAPPPPSAVTGFSVVQNGGSVVFTWDQVQDYALKGYDIAYAPAGTTNWSNFILLTEASKGTEMTNAGVPPGSWSFGIRARDIADQFSPTFPIVSLVVVNVNPVISVAAQEPDFNGTLSGFVKHYSGALVPLGTKTSDQYVRIPGPDAPILSAVANGALGATGYYVVASLVTANGAETNRSLESFLSVAANNVLKVRQNPTSGTTGATGWNVYVGLSSLTGTKQNPVPIPLGVDWTEPVSGLITGSAIPVDNTTGWEVFDVFVPDPVASASYISPTIDTGYDSTLRVFAPEVAVLGPGQSGTPDMGFAIDTWLTGQSDPNVFTNWTVGTVNMRYLRSKLTLTITPGSVPYVSSFIPTIDTAPQVEDGAALVVAPGGTVVTFPMQYHTVPNVQFTPTSAGATGGSATNVTTTQFTAHVFQGTTDGGGTGNWHATGA